MLMARSRSVRLANSERADSLVLSCMFALRYAYGHGRVAALLAQSDVDVADLISTARSTEVVHEFVLHVGSELHF
jgi:hypothetical protein